MLCVAYKFQTVVPRWQIKWWYWRDEVAREGGPIKDLGRCRANRQGWTARGELVTAPMNDRHEPTGAHNRTGGAKYLNWILRVENVKKERARAGCGRTAEALRKHVADTGMNVIESCCARPLRGGGNHRGVEVECVYVATDTRS